MTQTQAWLVQAASDLQAAQSVFKPNDHSTYCQALAKYQQVVEKSCKAIHAALQEAGIRCNQITRLHDPTGEIGILLLARVALGKRILNRLERIFPPKRLSQASALCRLAPKHPAPGQPFPRNTEYPFESEPGQWTAPASDGSFSEQEVQAAHELAWLLKHQADGFATAIRLRLK